MTCLAKHRLLLFYITAIIYLELVYRLWNYKGITLDFIFPVLFAFTAGSFLFLITSLFRGKAAWISTIVFTAILVMIYSTQLVYYCIFRVPLSIYSVGGAGDALQFKDTMFAAIWGNIIPILLLFIPLFISVIKGKKLAAVQFCMLRLGFIFFICIISYGISLLGVNLTDKNGTSQYTLYYKTFSPELSVTRLGLLTTMRLDVEHLIFRYDQGGAVETFKSESTDTEYESTAAAMTSVAATQTEAESEVSSTKPEQSSQTVAEPLGSNIMNIDFQALTANEKDKTVTEMHKYFSSLEPTKKNQYTGLFKGDNLILITAEGFSPYAVSETLTPTLYKMTQEGFRFDNFYNPLWGVSTSDGEYVACTGLIPKAGVWSFARSGQNLLPFVMGNQFKKLGYTTKAWHDHTYTYYKRNISHPNMGYDYKGVGSGLEITKSWPESDLEMIEATAGEYIGEQPFHTYYMTVSGHLQYNFGGNYMAKKNRAYVEELPLSNPCKAYIACNLELEFAMKALLEKLEAAGIAEKTVIAISPDHYPYGLPQENIEELAGHKINNNFELYKSIFILWKKGMEPVVVEKPCSSLDINPTLSNLFGLEYDSRLLMGRDIFSDASPLVIFADRSWISDRGRYDAIRNAPSFTDGTEKDWNYVKSINNIVANKFKFSAKILETDYYSKLFN